MLRFLLIITVFSFSGWSQPAQQQTQPPVAQTLSVNPWTQIQNLAPGIITALSGLVVVLLTFRHQRRLEFDKADIAAKYKSQDNRWAFRKDIYVNLVKSVSALLDKRSDFLVLVKQQSELESNSEAEVKLLHENKALNLHEYRALFAEFVTNMCIAELATADNALAMSTSALAQIKSNIALDSKEEQVSKDISTLTGLVGTLAIAGRKDLWPEKGL
jgi:hypothetical protein